MLIYNLTEYNKNYRKTTRSVWIYYRDEPNNPPLNPSVNKILLLLIIMQIPQQILYHLNIKAIL